MNEKIINSIYIYIINKLYYIILFYYYNYYNCYLLCIKYYKSSCKNLRAFCIIFDLILLELYNKMAYIWMLNDFLFLFLFPKSLNPRSARIAKGKSNN